MSKIENIEVSIICDTYNQEKYIEDAIKSFINQKTTFDYEILIHDDASTDNTRKIIEKYYKDYPNLIKPIFQKDNQYSKGTSIMDIQINRAKGKYIAFCEGDDYWIDKNKLQKQYNILENNSNIDMVAHDVITVNEESKKIVGLISPTNTERILKTEEVIEGGGGFLGTNSLFFRKTVLLPKPPLREKMELDYTLQIVGSIKGGIYYIPQKMSAYRICSKGSWTSSMLNNQDKLISVQRNIIDMLLFFNEQTNFKYDKAVKEAIRRTEFHIFEISNDVNALKLNMYKDLYMNLTLQTRIKIQVKRMFPFLKTIKRKIASRGK